MKVALWLLVLFAVAVAATLAAKNSGYILIVAQPYRVELSLNLMVLLLLVAFFILYFFVRLAAITLRLPAEVGEFRLRRRRQKAHKAMLEGFKAFLEGRYDKAEKASALALETTESPVVNALNAVIAARAAHEMGRYSERDQFMARAEAEAPKETALRLMTKAELLLDQRQPEEALQVLQTLHALGKRGSNLALWLELKAQQQLGNWNKVLELLGQLEQQGVANRGSHGLRCHAHVQNLKAIQDGLSLEAYWRDMAPADKEDVTLAAMFVRACITSGNCALARRIIEQSLDRQWDPELARLYGECPEKEAIGQIERAEAWLELHPDDPGLLLALGKLCTYQGLWGKAQNYLDASLSVESDYPAHLALAELNEKIGQPQLARDHYDKGLALGLNRLKALGRKDLSDEKCVDDWQELASGRGVLGS